MRDRGPSTRVDRQVRRDEAWALGCAVAAALLVVAGLVVYLWTL